MIVEDKIRLIEYRSPFFGKKLNGLNKLTYTVASDECAKKVPMCICLSETV